MSWIQTFTGRRFDLLQPEPAMVSVLDIAHALSHLCRFAGHTLHFYSVAQHSVLVSWHVAPEHALQALMHDAAEAYCVDVPKPLKQLPEMAGYRAAERRIWEAIAESVDLSPELSDEVKRADEQALATEARDLLAPPPAPWDVQCEPWPETITPWAAETAKRVFLQRFIDLTGPGVQRGR